MKKEKLDEFIIAEFNKGRIERDRFWINQINKRIEELERIVGITELKRIRDKSCIVFDDGEV